jgi:hypothetical protein
VTLTEDEELYAQAMFRERWETNMVVLVENWHELDDFVRCVGAGPGRAKKIKASIEYYRARYAIVKREGDAVAADDSLTNDEKTRRIVAIRYNERVMEIEIDLRRAIFGEFTREQRSFAMAWFEEGWVDSFRDGVIQWRRKKGFKENIERELAKRTRGGHAPERR